MRSRLRPLVTLVFFLAVAIVIGLYLRDVDWAQIRAISIRWPFLIVAVVLGLAVRYFSAFIWLDVLRSLGARDLPGFATLASVYSRAWMGRYLPGKVAWVGGKVYFAQDHGISRAKLAASSVLESLVQIVVIFAISVVVLVFDPRFQQVDPAIRTLIYLGGLGLVPLLHPRVFNLIMTLAARLLRRGDHATAMHVTMPTVARTSGLYGIGFLLSGASYFFLSAAFHPLAWGDFPFIISVFNLAGAVGIASLVAPSGIGVREGVQLALLPAVMPLETAVVLTVTARLFSTAVDVAFFAVAQVPAALGRTSATSTS